MTHDYVEPAHGVVRRYDEEQGWGVIDSAQTPGGCWFHFSSLEGDGYRSAQEGDVVTFRFETADQDGYGFRALWVETPESA